VLIIEAHSKAIGTQGVGSLRLKINTARVHIDYWFIAFLLSKVDF
jgi:hypothetical protein